MVETGVSSPGEVEIVVNGESLTLPGGLSLVELLDRVGRNPLSVAVEYNGRIVPRSEFSEVSLKEGDRLEVVQFVQGG